MKILITSDTCDACGGVAKKQLLKSRPTKVSQQAARSHYVQWQEIKKAATPSTHSPKQVQKRKRAGNAMINSITIPLFAHTDGMLQHLKCMQSLKSPATLMIFGCRLTLDPSNPCSSSLGMSWVLPYPLPSSCPA